MLSPNISQVETKGTQRKSTTALASHMRKCVTLVAAVVVAVVAAVVVVVVAAARARFL